MDFSHIDVLKSKIDEILMMRFFLGHPVEIILCSFRPPEFDLKFLHILRKIRDFCQN